MKRLSAVSAALLSLLTPGTAAATMWGTMYRESDPTGSLYVGATKAQNNDIVRLPIRWNKIQHDGPGEPYRWDRVDDFIEGFASTRQVRVLFNVHGAPWWARGEPEETDQGNAEPPLPQHYLEYRAFLRAAAERYGPEGDFFAENPGVPERPVRYWEIWNEPNGPGFWTNRTPDPEQYGALARVSGAVIHRVDPDARVIAGSVTMTCRKRHMCPGEFIRRMYAVPGVRENTDDFSFHAYGHDLQALRGATRNARTLVTRHDSPRTGLHLTEFGVGTCAAEAPDARLCVTEQRQADYLVRAFDYLAANRRALSLRSAEWFIQFDFHGEDGRCSQANFCFFGLFRRPDGELAVVGPKGHFPTLAPKPAWYAFRDWARTAPR